MAPDARTVGRYRLFRPLAMGGDATFYLGCLRSEVGFSRTVGIKKLHEHHAREERLVASLLVEAKIVSRIRHPNVAAVLDVVAADGEILVVLEYVHGESLSQLLIEGREKQVPLGVALRIGVDALEGLHAAHEATSDGGAPLLVVHRDVSPQNLVVGVDGQARIVDFGIAKALERPYTTTSNGEFRGKLAYAAPEQLAGSKVDRRTDVWAMGMVLWELIAGRRFFVDAEPEEIVRRITDEIVQPPSSVNPSCPAAIDAIVLRALERDPDARFSSAREMALALEKQGALASHRDVGRWVRTLARSRLESREHLISEMEAELRRAPEPSPRVAASTSVEPQAVAAGAMTPPIAPALAKTPSRRWGAVALAALATVVGVMTIARFGNRGPAPTLSEGPSASPSQMPSIAVPASSPELASAAPALAPDPPPPSNTGSLANARPSKTPRAAHQRVVVLASSNAPGSRAPTAMGEHRQGSGDPLKMDDRN